ncbi:MAG: hypothetical protein COA57_13925 [Flavobacteriales bacterium]|nr:MAG: hypothetical protein COA57_13925 [Flavobacteriales bacterium]
MLKKINYRIIFLLLLILIPVGVFIYKKTPTENEIQNPAQQKINALLKKIKEYPTAENYLDLSLAYYRINEHKKSIEAADNAMALKPNYAHAYNNKCVSLIKMGKHDEAIKACEKAIEIEPSYKLAKNNLNWAKEMKRKAQ